METNEQQKNYLEQIEAFANIFNQFMLSDTPRKLLTKLDRSWQQTLLLLEQVQRKSNEVFKMLLTLLKTKLELIYTSQNKHLGMSYEVLSGDIHYITYNIIATTIFKIEFLTDTTLEENITYFNYQEFSKSLVISVNGIIGPNVLNELKKEQKQKIQDLKNTYKQLLQTYQETERNNSISH